MERSSKPPLHNFSLPYLRWGNQRLLRCVKVDSSFSSPPPPPPYTSNSNGFQSKPVPPIYDIPKATTTTHVPPPPLPAAPDQVNIKEKANGDASNSSRPPWNLRTTRAACKVPSPLRVLEESRAGGQESGYSPRMQNFLEASKKEKEVVKDGGVIKFSVSLSREEIEEDFAEMGRNRPPRRPKKRPRVVQKYLDSVFPGLWLSEITPDSYKVAEVPES